MQTTATKVIKFNAVAGLHSIVLSYAELIDYGNPPQQFKHFNIFMVSSLALYDKKMTLPSRYQLILFSLNLNIFQWEGNKINCFTLNSVIKFSGCSKIN